MRKTAIAFLLSLSVAAHAQTAVSGEAPTDVPHDAPANANLHLDHWASSCPVTRFAHGERNIVRRQQRGGGSLAAVVAEWWRRTA